MAILKNAVGPITLSPGDVNQLGPLLTATGNSISFNIQRGPGSTAPKLTLEAQGTASAVAATLQASFDGGVTWETWNANTALNLLLPVVIEVVPGPLYRVAVTTLTGGNATILAGVS